MALPRNNFVHSFLPKHKYRAEIMYYLTLSQQQPYASMLVKGLMNVVRIASQHPLENRRILIYATEPVSDPATPIEWVQEVNNQQSFGNLADTQDLPRHELVGFVDVLGPADPDTNVWAAGKGERAYLVGNAHEFVMPLHITPNEVQEHLDFIKRVNTTVHIPRCPFFKDNGNNLVLPVNVFLDSLAWNEQDFSIELVGDFAKLVLYEHGLLKPFLRYTIWHGGIGRTFAVDDDTEVRYEINADNSDLRRYPSALAPDGTTTRAKLHFSCRFPLND